MMQIEINDALTRTPMGPILVHSKLNVKLTFALIVITRYPEVASGKSPARNAGGYTGCTRKYGASENPMTR